MLTQKQKILKRFFDVFCSSISIFILFIPIIILIVISSISTKSFGVFFQKRVGQHGKIFTIIKLKTMVDKKNKNINSNNAINNKRITKFGEILRKSKLDELPQLINVLKGEMSFVGPRPDIKGYADELIGDDKIILTVKPGITGPATIFFKNEELLLSKQSNPKKYNDEVIWVKKIEMNKDYLKNWSFTKDINYIIKTIL